MRKTLLLLNLEIFTSQQLDPPHPLPHCSCIFTQYEIAKHPACFWHHLLRVLEPPNFNLQ